MSRSVFCCGELYKASVIFTKLIECNVDKVVFHLVCGSTTYYVERQFLSIEEFTLGIVSGWHRGHSGTTLRRTLSDFFKDIVRFVNIDTEIHLYLLKYYGIYIADDLIWRALFSTPYGKTDEFSFNNHNYVKYELRTINDDK